MADDLIHFQAVNNGKFEDIWGFKDVRDLELELFWKKSQASS